MFFVLDPTPEGDSDGDGVDDKAHIMDEYSEATEDMITALKEERVVVSKEPYQDLGFLSGMFGFMTEQRIHGSPVLSEVIIVLCATYQASNNQNHGCWFLHCFHCFIVWFTAGLGWLSIRKIGFAYVKQLKPNSNGTGIIVMLSLQWKNLLLSNPSRHRTC